MSSNNPTHSIVQTVIDEELRQRPDINCTVERAERLDRALRDADPSNPAYGYGIKRLRDLCRRLQHVPTSCMLKDVTVTHGPLFRTALSDVYKGIHGSTEVAVKALRVNATDIERIKRNYRDEVTYWKHLKHPNIVGFIGISTVLPVCFVSEWMTNGDLVKYLINHPNANRLDLAKDVLSGIYFMHSIGLIHGDLKCLNVLVDSSRHARLTDFGLATVLSGTTSESTSAAGRGTLRWMAPELLGVGSLGMAHNGRSDKASDMYAVGMVLYEIFTGRIPFDDHKDYTVINAIISGKHPVRPPAMQAEGPPDYLWQLFMECWSRIPVNRPSARHVLRMLTTSAMLNTNLTLDSGLINDASMVSTPAEVTYGGVYEIVSCLDNSVIGLAYSYVDQSPSISPQVAHGGSSQRWCIEHTSRGYTLQNVLSEEFLAGQRVGVPRSWTPHQRPGEPVKMANASNMDESFWRLLSDASGVMIKYEDTTNSLPHLGPSFYLTLFTTPQEQYFRLQDTNELPQINANAPRFHLRKELVSSHIENLDATLFQIINVVDGLPLHFSETTSRPDVATSDIRMSTWELTPTRRGYAVRSQVARAYLTPEEHRNGFQGHDYARFPPIRSGMSLRTGNDRTSWWFQPVEGTEIDLDYRDRSYRICWPDGLFAITAIAGGSQSKRQVLLAPTVDDNIAMHWRLVPRES